MSSVASRRRKRKARNKHITLPGWGVVTPPENGQGARNDLRDDDQAPALEKRLRVLGLTRADRNTARLPHLAEPTGWALHLVHGTDGATELWEVVSKARSILGTYRAHVTGAREWPSTGSVPVLPEKFEARADDSPTDDRTEDEKAEAAKKRMAWLEGVIGDCNFNQAESKIVWHGFEDDGRRRFTRISSNGVAAVTQRGRVFCACIERLKEVMEESE